MKIFEEKANVVIYIIPFYWSLTRPYARKMKGDPEIIDAKALLDKMRPYAKEKGITVRQVLLLDGGPTAAEQSA